MTATDVYAVSRAVSRLWNEWNKIILAWITPTHWVRNNIWCLPSPYPTHAHLTHNFYEVSQQLLCQAAKLEHSHIKRDSAVRILKYLNNRWFAPFIITQIETLKHGVGWWVAAWNVLVFSDLSEQPLCSWKGRIWPCVVSWLQQTYGEMA
jgi:hypothetical protein